MANSPVTCSVGGCGRSVRARGLCGKHYRYAWANHMLGTMGTPLPIGYGSKAWRVCPKCGGKKYFYSRNCQKCQVRPERATTRHASLSPTLRHIAWAAGFIEGEGCFRAAGGWKGKDGTSKKPCEVITVTQKQREPLERLQEWFGGNITLEKPGSRPTPLNNWHVSGARAHGIMLTLYAMMSPWRKAQITAALKAARVPLRP